VDVIGLAADVSSRLKRVLASAARLQEAVPDAVLAGDAAMALRGRHRVTHSHEHVLADLVDRYETVLEAVEETEGWATSVRASKPPFTIMGRLGGVEAGLRQLRRSRPLETAKVKVGDEDEHEVTVPTLAETLRIAAYLVIQRRLVRDFIDLVALSDALGYDEAIKTLLDIDSYYEDRSGEEGSVLTSLLIALADPKPRDIDVIDELIRYKGLEDRYRRWEVIVEICRILAPRLLEAD